MGIFLRLTFELHCADTRTQNRIMGKTLDYFVDNLNNETWQDNASKKIRINDETQIAIMVYLRFFRQAMIEENKLKSYAKYLKKDECLIIDPIFILEDYMQLDEDKCRERVCKEIYSYLEIVLIKYKNRIHDFDVIAFIPILKNRIEKIKSNSFPYVEHDELEDLLDGILDENLNLIE